MQSQLNSDNLRDLVLILQQGNEEKTNTQTHAQKNRGQVDCAHSVGVAQPMLQSGAAARFSGPEQRVGYRVSVGGLAE